MDPGQLAKDLLQKHFPKFGSIRKECSYSSNPNPDYDPDTNITDPLTPVVQDNVWIIFDSRSTSVGGYRSKQMGDDKSVVEEKLAMIPTLDLNVKPKEKDTITEVGTENVWSVRAVDFDPADAMWTLLVRPTRIVVVP